jgi:hypothetical protein
MTHRELQLLAARERVTLRQRVRNSRRYWDICARHRGELFTRYLCTDSALATLSEDDFLRRVRSLPGRGDAATLAIAYLPGEVMRVQKGPHTVVLSHAELHELARRTHCSKQEVAAQMAVQPEAPPDTHTPDDDAADDEGYAEPAWPDDFAGVCARLEHAGFVLTAENATYRVYAHPATSARRRVQHPPSRECIRVHIEAHRDADWQDIAERLALIGGTLGTPTRSTLPKYPERWRAHGTLAPVAASLDAVAHLRAALRAEQAQRIKLEQQVSAALGICAHYQRHLNHAHTYKVDSERGKASALLLIIIDKLLQALGGPTHP